ncbi:piggyBac transposable element-derived protein 4-like protein [Lates japonicus]|uniref:PiggyBac transposable element-derived protein 4-like protein n=1 Tax=Lates japonicus TaxID=270547 RepID=A0AAD3MMD4_LATJO|nr:piggyBac transposable element-derived protein 4-like protein [Lates japonicus]
MEASAPALKERNDPDMDAAPAATTAPATISPQLKQRPQVPAGDGTSQATVVSYCPKKGKNVLLMSTMHRDAVLSTREDRKPQMAWDYNEREGRG